MPAHTAAVLPVVPVEVREHASQRRLREERVNSRLSVGALEPEAVVVLGMA